MRSSMFPWSNLHAMYAYLDSLCIFEDDTNRPKENVPPPFPLTYPKIHLTIVPGIIRYSNTSHFNIVFVDAVHT